MSIYIVTVPDWYWIFFVCWLIFTGLGIFLVPELIAVFNTKRGDTFSEFIWRWQGKETHRKRLVFFTLLALFVLLAWLVPHFIFDGIV